MLATRIGGRSVWGECPWFEAAFLGGGKNLRSYRKNRFSGDRSLYANVELRSWLFNGRLIAPGRWGVFGLADVGRVWLEGESSDAWHASYGGGIFFQMLTLNQVFHAMVATGDEGTRFRVDYGFSF
jgi:hemolysin activation/secretion protein